MKNSDKSIKRINTAELSDKFGLKHDSDAFIYKPIDVMPNKKMQPHRSDTYSLGIILEGEAKLMVGIDSYNVVAPAIITISPDQIRHWHNPSNGFKNISLFFTEEFAINGLADAFFLKKLSFFKNTGNHYLPLNPKEFNTISTYFSLIQNKFESDHVTKYDSIRAILYSLLVEINHLQNNNSYHIAGNSNQAKIITQNFKALLAKNYIEHRSVEFYAGKLFITPKHLSQILKEQTGKTTREIIAEIVCLEAQVLLQMSDMSIAEISHYLNFADPSFFGKYFKRQTSMSPKQYKNSLIG